MLTNPVAQLAVQQAMNEITDCLALIDAKVDAVLRAQTEKVLNTGTEGLGVAGRFGAQALGRARSTMGDVTERARRRLGSKEQE
jgi:hypothetical protein